MAEAARAINNLATALDRVKEFSGKEDDFQQWSKKTEAFFAGVIKDSEMMLEWAAEQTTEIATELLQPWISADCDEPGARITKPGVRAAADANSTHGSHESRGERHCCQHAEEPTGGVAEAAETIWPDNRRKEEKLSAHDHFSGTVPSSGILCVSLREEAEG